MYEPAPQYRLHDDDPLYDHVPEAQEKHPVEPLDGAYDPAGQALHPLHPELLE